MPCFPLMLAVLSTTLLAAETPPSFEVATVRPTEGPIPGVPPLFGQQATTADRLTARHTLLVEIIKRAYSVGEQDLKGVPDWVREERFDIVGKSAEPASGAQLWSMVRPLLEERFNLRFHREPRTVSGFALVIGKNGAKLTRSEGGSSSISLAGGVLTARNAPLSSLAQILSGPMRQPVVDATGLDGGYDFILDPKEYSGSPLITIVQDKLGLTVEPRKVELQMLVIDHIERPSEN